MARGVRGKKKGVMRFFADNIFITEVDQQWTGLISRVGNTGHPAQNVPLFSVSNLRIFTSVPPEFDEIGRH